MHRASTPSIALATLLRTDANTFWANLGRSRLAPVSGKFIEGALATLPPEGQILSLDDAAWRKLAGAQQIFRLHERDSIYVIKVIDVPDAFVGLHARSIILVSQTALSLLTAEELQASLAHEAGHEYVWLDFEEARKRTDFDRLQELELFSDAVAVVTMVQAGLDPSRLISCFEKLIRYTREHFERHENEARYASSNERKMFVERIIKWAGGNPPQPR